MRGLSRVLNNIPNVTSRKGQSLVEILVAVAVGGILISSAVVLLLVSTRIGKENRFIQSASFLAQDMLENVSVFAEQKWYCPGTDGSGGVPTCGIYNLRRGQPEQYAFSAGVPLQAVLGTDTVTQDGVIYQRYFFVENVNRELCGIGRVTPGGTTICGQSFGQAGIGDDPSTLKVTAVVGWQGGTGEARLSRYITRNKNELFHQTDWVGGLGQATFPGGSTGVSSVNNRFDTHTCMNVTTAGQIKIEPNCP